jgi:hypothetical protein
MGHGTHSSPNGLWWCSIRSPCKHIASFRGSSAHGDRNILGIPCIRVRASGIRNAHQRLVVIVIPPVAHIDRLLRVGGVGERRDGERWDRPGGGVCRERGGVGEPDDGG